ncbi:hypothetical protein B484DRAFT_399000, partial [Ochromonadaceae sp. CCMP2298]
MASEARSWCSRLSVGEGEALSLATYKGKKAYLVVNVASKTTGLEILAFPCNNFGSQEPGANAEVLEFAKGKGATFPILGKL